MSYKRRIKVINPKFQYSTAGIAVVCVAISLNAILLMASFFPLQTGLYVNFSGMQLFGVCMIELLLLGLIWSISIRMSHKHAGPAYAFGRELGKLAHGDLNVKITLRPGDAFEDVAEEINVGLTNLRLQIEAIKITVAELDKSTTTSELKQHMAKLKFQLDKLKTSQSA